MMSMMWIRAILLLTLFISAFGFTTMRNSFSSMRGQMFMMAKKKQEIPAKPEAVVTSDAGCKSVTAAQFPYGVNSFPMIIEENRFWSDKTMYIKKLEAASNHIKIWRPRRFGKTLVCDMLEQYYDMANNETQRDALFGQTEMMTTTPSATTYHMGKYLVLRLAFSRVSSDGDVQANFRTSINRAVRNFSKKYYKAKLLDDPIDVNPEDAPDSLQSLFDEVRTSRKQIYLIVDECDSFVSRLMFSVNTSRSDNGLSEYKDLVSGQDSMLRNWGNFIKEGTCGTIARSFFTGVQPVAFADGLSSLNMVLDLTFNPRFAEMFGLTSDDVRRGLHRIGHLTEQQRSDYLEQIRLQYDGYRFVRNQKEGMYNPQYVHYFLNHLDQLGVPPESLIDNAVSTGSDNVAAFLLSKQTSISPFSLLNFLMGITAPQAMEIFELDVVPTFRSNELFEGGMMGKCLISLAYYHGFLTYKTDKEGRTFLTSPNLVAKAVYVEMLFP
ncbi:hypothetical protein B484DRAFT_471205 [Ochromonadaceae sp. CCMP2298]|nr:hypothetical protein B484DRAFT_471205 [Ochromonadaceae sp. CCMP2298]